MPQAAVLLPRSLQLLDDDLSRESASRPEVFSQADSSVDTPLEHKYALM
jgi:hypothetical protein